MKNKSEYLKFLLLGVAIALFAYSFPACVPQRASFFIGDLPYWYVYHFSHRALRPLKVVGVEIDDYSLNRSPDRWPWSRSVYAALIRVLDKEQVGAVGIDLVFAGESESKESDAVFKDALNSATLPVTLAYLFDYKEGRSLLPFGADSELKYHPGMVNTPEDGDSRVRRLRGYIALDGQTYYSFSVALAGSFLGQSPEDVVKRIPLGRDRTFLINYLLKDTDITRVSFHDVVNNIGLLKEKHGSEFLKGSLVLVYPAAGIFHDRYLTPLGSMPGGILHLNGATDVITGRFLRKSPPLSVLLFILSFLAIAYILSQSGFLSALLLVLGVFLADFWLAVGFALKGIQLDYSVVVVLGTVFFTAASLYRYLLFLGRLLKIKYRVTLDPLRNVFTLRYFYYRLELELKKIYFRREFYLVLINLGKFTEALEDRPLENIRDAWRQIGSLVSLKGSFWSAYSQDELVGCVVSSSSGIGPLVKSIYQGLEVFLRERDIQLKTGIAYARINKNYDMRGLLFVLSEHLKKAAGGVLPLEERDLAELLKPAYSRPAGEGRVLESIGEDIEEKNRQLLTLIENLRKEHAKTKQAFFEIISSLVNALEARDSYTQGHSQRVADYSLRLAAKLGWPAEEKEKLRKAALLHDLGKIGIPDNILHKKGSLTNEEYDLIKQHEVIAVRILEPLNELKEILPWILYHHERWDGKGYPHGLAGNAIPQASQIISIADVYDALTTGRDYKQAFSVQDSIAEMVRSRGAAFNPELVDLFVEMMVNSQPKNDLHTR